MKNKFIIKKAHFGEILQGIYPSYSKSNRCIVTFPIDINLKKNILNNDFIKSKKIFSYITFKKSNTLEIKPKKFFKSFKLIRQFEEKFKVKIKGTFNIKSNIPLERGMGSSSVDLITLCKALKKIKNLNISKNQIYNFCCDIEATDPLLNKKISVFSTIIGKNISKSNIYYPPLKIFSYDTSWGKKGIKTENVATPNYTKKDLIFFERAFNYIEKMKDFNIIKIKKISLKSLIINQRFYPKKNFHKIINIIKKIKDGFLIGAHSGTVIGVAFKYNYNLKKKDILYLKKLSRILKSPITKYENIE